MGRFRLFALLIVLAQVVAAAAPQPGLTLAGVYRRGIDVTRYLQRPAAASPGSGPTRDARTAAAEPVRARAASVCW